ncbi:hypothetical protein Tsubulata_007336 [Turnera subulata]|uniref:NAB domain-containing protein n=1 Tax=Turnera subulata TaxID=218843 RepID=A0A9Q0FMQ9_9ROSI|nr:hypothetical protein Tsubulata_007336 [Turnera subulata]
MASNKKCVKRSLISVMDQSVRRMLKLIEEDGDSFAKKAEMYYQKRPELISLVEEFYRMYRSLAERYDHVTGELRKNIPSDLQSVGSGVFSDTGSELPSTWPSPAPDPRSGRRKSSGPRAAGFDFFLGPGAGGSESSQKEGDESSTLTDSDSESEDDSDSVNNFSVLSGNSGDQGMHRKVIELEIELREMKEKLRMQDEEGDGNDNVEDLLGRISGYEKELLVANERTSLLEEEVSRLNLELEKFKSLEFAADNGNPRIREGEMEVDMGEQNTEGLEGENLAEDSKVQELMEELRITKERLQSSEEELVSLKNGLDTSDGSNDKVSKLEEQLALARKDAESWKTKVNAEKREMSKLKERVSRLKSSLSDRDHEIRDLKMAVSDAEEKIFPEKAQIKAEIARLLEEQKHFQEQLKEWESRGRSLEDEIRKLQSEKKEIDSRLNRKVSKLQAEIARRDDRIKDLDKTIRASTSERDELNVKIEELKADVLSRDDRISEMDKHLEQLHMQHVELISGTEEARKLMDGLKLKTKDLEEEVERQRVMIEEGAEEKREAIRQLCFSIEHYRDGYHSLRQAFMGNRRVPVLAT